MRERVIESFLQTAFHAFRQQMLVVINDPPELGEGDFLGCRAGHLDNPVLNCQFLFVGFEHVGGEFEDFCP